MYKTTTSTHIKDLIKASIEMMERQGYSRHHIKRYRNIYNILEKYAESNTDGKYTEQTGGAFLAETARRNLSLYSLRCYKVAIKRIDAILTGETDWYPPRPQKEYAHSNFDDILRKYETYQHDSGKNGWDIRGDTAVVARFLRFVTSCGIERLDDLTVKCVYDAFQDTSNKRNFQKCVSAFLRYAYRRSLVKTDLSPIVPSAKRHQPVPTVYSKEEIETLLASVNRETAVGKRNYAILLIVARLGLRACDVVNLKFNNVNMSGKYIELVQTKTKEYLKLPLLLEIQEALSEYVDHARPQCENETIFLKFTPPYTDSLRPKSVYCICSRLLEKTDIPTKNRRRGPHALRSSLATALLDEGNSHRTIQQALGQKDPDTVKSYVKTDVSHLRVCALFVPAPSGVLGRLLSAGGIQ